MPPNIQKRGNLYHARLGIPSDLRDKFNKREFKQSLETSDRQEAEIRALAVVSRWKRQIAAARGSLDAIEKMAADIRVETDYSEEDAVTGMTGKDWHIESIADSFNDEEKEIRFRNIAMGRKTPFITFLDKFLEQWEVDQKTKDMASSFIKKIGNHFKSIESISRPEVLRLVRKDSSANSTKTKNFAFARRYWKYLEDEGIVSLEARNPFSELNLKTNKKKAEAVVRKAFSKADIESLHCEALKSEDRILGDLIALGAYTGARIDELCELTVDDVLIAEGVQVLSIRDAKTKAGVRSVPVHPELKTLIKRLVEQTQDGYLVFNQTSNKYQKRSNALGKRFGRLKKKLGFGADFVFHSIRKTVITELENAGIPEGVSADIVGHEKKTMTYGLYSAGTSDKKKFEAIKNLEYKLEI